MSWEPEIEELRRRHELAAGLGGADNVARHHARGRLTVRERIDLLADKGSFREFGALVGAATYDDGDLVAFVPKSTVNGGCTIDGRKVILSGNDFTVRGGSGGAVGWELGQEAGPAERAGEWRLPFIRLLDSAGGSVRSFEEIGRTYLPDGNSLVARDVALLNEVPVVAAVLGSVAGGPAVAACIAHFNVMVDGTSQLFAGGPPVVKAAFGLDIDKQDLGGARVHAHESGVVDNLAATEEDALRQIRRFLSYLPSNVWEVPPRVVVGDPVDRRDEELVSIIPRNQRQPYRMHELIDHVVDEDSFFEIGALYGRSRITGLARVDGYPVGVLGNDPMHGAGSTDVTSGDKVMRLMQLCDTFHLPLVSFTDEPGFMVGLESERRGIERAGARLVWTTVRSRMPWITFVVRRLFGVGGQCHHRPSGMFRRYAWPSATWGSMPIQGGVSAAYRRDIEAAEDPAAQQAEIERRLEELTSPFRTAEATGQDIIDPRDTRPLLAEFVQDAQPILAAQVGAPVTPYRP
ncbi:MAG TPA: carboxyl transferase domain-containing protein [Nitriliruptorales bacterium]